MQDKVFNPQDIIDKYNRNKDRSIDIEINNALVVGQHPQFINNITETLKASMHPLKLRVTCTEATLERTTYKIWKASIREYIDIDIRLTIDSSGGVDKYLGYLFYMSTPNLISSNNKGVTELRKLMTSDQFKMEIYNLYSLTQ